MPLHRIVFPPSLVVVGENRTWFHHLFALSQFILHDELLAVGVKLHAACHSCFATSGTYSNSHLV